MAEEPRFDWSAIFRVVGIVVAGTAAVGLIVPPAATMAFGLYDTGIAADNEIYQWAYWAVAWGLTIWQGSWMLRRVGDKIIDDMLVMSIIAAAILTLLKIIINLIYVPIESGVFSSIDAGGALMLIVVALIGARINKY